MDRKVRFLGLFGLMTVLLSPLYAQATETAIVSPPFVYDFSSPGLLEESLTMRDSTSPYFWLNGGAELIIEDGLGKTIQSDLPPNDPWRAIYAKKNPLDTEVGSKPQNVFRLITRSEWRNFSQVITFKIIKTNFSSSYNRDGYSGIFLLSQYKDESNYYYGGIRMDGQVVIKKKSNGVFYTLGAAQAFGSIIQFKRRNNMTLLPQDKQMRLKLETRELNQNSTELILSLEKDNGSLVTLLGVVDRNPMHGTAYAGIESDFMNVVLDDYAFSK